jgi:hypothetical protein
MRDIGNDMRVAELGEELRLAYEARGERCGLQGVVQDLQRDP